MPTYKGPLLENFFKTLFAESKLYNQIGAYWDFSHEIDLVAINDMKKIIVMAEFKSNKTADLKKKAEKLLERYPGYQPEYLALSLQDAKNFLML